MATLHFSRDLKTTESRKRRQTPAPFGTRRLREGLPIAVDPLMTQQGFWVRK